MTGGNLRRRILPLQEGLTFSCFINMFSVLFRKLWTRMLRCRNLCFLVVGFLCCNTLWPTVMGQLPSGSVDFLGAVSIDQAPLGVTQTTGFCDKRAIKQDENGDPIYGSPDVAYTLNPTAVLTVTTAQLFTAGFPYDFSILATIRPEQGSDAFLFTIYNNVGQEQMAMGVGDNVTFQCRQSADLPTMVQVNFPVPVNDGKWHRVALSVKGNSVTFINECGLQQTESLERSEDAYIDNSGIILIGQQLVDGVYYEGDIQQLQIVPSPEAAYEQCIDYIPNCDTPFPYATGPEDTIYPVYPGPGFPDTPAGEDGDDDDDDDDEDSDFPDFPSVHPVHPNYTTPDEDLTGGGGENTGYHFYNVQGLPGPRGYQGSPGHSGQKGEKGDPGRDGLSGLDGSLGPPGHIFMIPYQPQGDVKGPDNTESLRQMLSQHMLAMRGAPGPVGLAGLAGPVGPPGVSGPKGEPGETGEEGPRGLRGMMGLPGRARPV